MSKCITSCIVIYNRILLYYLFVTSSASRFNPRRNSGIKYSLCHSLKSKKLLDRLWKFVRFCVDPIKMLFPRDSILFCKTRKQYIYLRIWSRFLVFFLQTNYWVTIDLDYRILLATVYTRNNAYEAACRTMKHLPISLGYIN